MLEQIDSLPGAELESSLGDGNGFARARQRHTKMTGGIIRPLGRMDQVGMILRDKILEEAVEIGARRRIGILIDHQTRAGMLDKDRSESRLDSAAGKQACDLVCDLIGPLPSGWHNKTLGECDHRKIRMII